MVRKKAAVCGEERCVTTLKTAAKETNIYLIEFSLWGKLFQLTDSPQADPFLSVHCLIGVSDYSEMI